MNLFTDLSNLPSHLKGVLVGALLLTTAIAAGAFAVSYTALFDLAEGSGTVGIVWIWPLLIDAFLVVSELTLVGMAMINGNRLLPFVFMVAMGAATVLFNLVHAPDTLTAQAIAAVPPLVSIGATILIAALVKALARALGKPLTYAPPPQPMAGMLGPMQGTIYRQDQVPIPPGYGYPLQPSQYAQYPLPAPTPSESVPAAQPLRDSSQNGQAGGSNGDQVPAILRPIIEGYLEAIRGKRMTVPEIVAALNAMGLQVHQRWVEQIQSEQSVKRGKTKGS